MFALVVALESRDVVETRSVRRTRAVLDQLHHAGRRRHDLGQRRDVEDRVERHRLGRRLDGAPADRLLIDDAIAAADEHDGARELLLGDRLFDERRDRVEPRESRSDAVPGAARALFA